MLFFLLVGLFKKKNESPFFGAGAGKSHLLNEVFFEGRPVFKTSPLQNVREPFFLIGLNGLRLVLLPDSEEKRISFL